MIWREVDEQIERFKTLKIPNVNHYTQQDKIQEEIREIQYANTWDNKRKEAVDVYIAARLDYLIFGSIPSKIISLFVRQSFSLTCKEVMGKIEENFKREWRENKKGNYHHEG